MCFFTLRNAKGMTRSFLLLDESRLVCRIVRHDLKLDKGALLSFFVLSVLEKPI